MRSTETSGVGANGFGTTKIAVEAKISTLSTITAPARPLFRKISSVTVAVTLCALLTVALFMIVDAARTFEEARVRLNLISRSLAGDLGSMKATEAGSALLRAVPAYDPHLIASLRDHSGRVIAANDAAVTDSMATVVESTPLGSLTLRYSTVDLFAGVLLRGLAAFGAALLLIAVVVQRCVGLHDAIGQRRFRDIVATVPFGMAYWNDRGELLHCNEQYRDRLQMDAGDRRPALKYRTAIKHLAQGGFTQVISDTKAGRNLELRRDDGSCLLVDERPLPEGGFLTLITDVTE
ncbi:MAG: histidine kinase, partial [Hyphomicrobiales bacterium]|nr:histidine kinase [Hyphomicrobiales bacterium]